MLILEANEINIKFASNIIRGGGVVIYLTETVYGIGCDPTQEEAAKRVCEVKGREKKALPLIASDIESVKKVVTMNPTAEKLAKKFWPGPLMLILPAKIAFSNWVTQGANTLGIRITSHPLANRLAELSGGLLVSTSANLSGFEPALSAQDAAEQIGKNVDLILDGGISKTSQPSTVLDLSLDIPKVLRIGPISEDQINKVVKSL
jgi:L-threonylcarbamoyladenylate synthase